MTNKNEINYFQNLFSTEDQQPQTMQHQQEKGKNALPPTIGEVKQAILAQRNNKAPGTNKLPSELFKSGRGN